ncbi:Enkurin domain [Trinorchestia longiramus]|nr:Enkurin domain [Trinorchestia longiramus]
MSKYEMREVPMRRGLSPEGRAIRARHQSSIVFGDTPAHDARIIQNSLERDRVSQENLTSLARQPGRGSPVTSSSTSGPCPLRATHPLPRMLASDLSTTAGGCLPGLSSNSRPVLKAEERDGSAHSDYFSLGEESLHQDDHLTHGYPTHGHTTHGSPTHGHPTHGHHTDKLSKQRDQSNSLSDKYDRLNTSTIPYGQPEIVSTVGVNEHDLGNTYSLNTFKDKTGEMSSHNAAMEAAAHATYDVSPCPLRATHPLPRMLASDLSTTAGGCLTGPEIVSTVGVNEHDLGNTYSLNTSKEKTGEMSSHNAAMEAAAHATYDVSKGRNTSSLYIGSSQQPHSGVNGYSTYTINEKGNFNANKGTSYSLLENGEPESSQVVAQSCDKQHRNIDGNGTYSMGQIGLEIPSPTSNVRYHRPGNSGEFCGTETYTIAQQVPESFSSDSPSNIRHYRDVNSSHLNGMGTYSIGQETIQSSGSTLLPNVQQTATAATNTSSNGIPIVGSGSAASQYKNANCPVDAIERRPSPRNVPVTQVPTSSNVSHQNFEGKIQGNRSPISDSSGSDRKALLNGEEKAAGRPTHKQLDYRESGGSLRSENYSETRGSDSLDSVRAAAAEALSVIGQNIEGKKAAQRQKNQELSADNPLVIAGNCDAQDRSESNQRYSSFSSKPRSLLRGFRDGVNHVNERPEISDQTKDSTRVNGETLSPGRHRNYAHQKDSISSIIRNIDNDLLYLSRESKSPPLRRFSNASGRPSHLNPLSLSNAQSKGNSPPFQVASNSPRRWSSSPSVIDENNGNGAPDQSSGNINRTNCVPFNANGSKSQSSINSESQNGEGEQNSKKFPTQDTGRQLSGNSNHSNGVVNSEISSEKEQRQPDQGNHSGSSSSRSPRSANHEKNSENLSNVSPVGHQKSPSLTSLDGGENSPDKGGAVGHHKYYPSLDATYSKDSLLSRLQGSSSTGLLPAAIHRPSDFTRSLRNNSMHSQNWNRRKPMKASDIPPTLADGRAVDSASVISRELRQTKVSDVIAKIKEKKPTCDMNYLTVKHNIERQHRNIFSHDLKAKEYEKSNGSNLLSARSMSTNKGVRSRSVDSSRRFPDPNKPKESQVLSSYSSQTNLTNRRSDRENWRSREPVKHTNENRNRKIAVKKMTAPKQNNLQRHRQQLPNRQGHQHQVPPLALQNITHTTMDESRSKNPCDSLGSVDINSVDDGLHPGSIKVPLDVRSNSLASLHAAEVDAEDESQNPPPVRRKGSTESGQVAGSSHDGVAADHPLARIAELPSGSGTQSSSGLSSRPASQRPAAAAEDDYVTSTPRGELDQQQFHPPSASSHPKAAPSTLTHHASQRAGRRLSKEKAEAKARSKSGEPPPNYKRGQVPRYLRARRAEQERAEAEEAARDPACPAHHTRLPESERLSTLSLLRHSEYCCATDYQMHPNPALEEETRYFR